MRRGLLAGLALLGLAACARDEAPAPEGGVGEVQARALAVVDQVRGVFRGIGSDTTVSAPREIPGGFTPQAIAAEPGAYRLVQINALGVQEPARVIETNGDEVTIALQSGPTAAFDDGILVSTHGFGDDLVTIDSAGVREAMRAGGGPVTRRMEMLDAQDRVTTTSFACAIAPAGQEVVDLGLRQASLRRFDERCQSPALIFSNIYWLDDAGNVVSSRQYVSPTVAYLRSGRL
ncbi:YjbF family lipoprotein [Rubellimicrobium aerolatum]|uniref:YjbF family lipoprotein n=1 Tax=Rubellimicrobium aerolatum TaxID=490979 RepID=A0ABW0SAE1_9RHOB|nr:YjbF family lipoprotein [Rubellimicrobium aerolatum]MBP1805286.1 hypothetical protein [Rubellimicrobium aerolatum]